MASEQTALAEPRVDPFLDRELLQRRATNTLAANQTSTVGIMRMAACIVEQDATIKALAAKLAEAKAEVERLKATLHRYDTKLATAETAANWCARALDADSALAATKAELKTVLDREAATIARYDTKMAEAEAALKAAREALQAVHEQLECPARNTNRGRAYREGVTISNDVREMVAAALTPKEAPDEAL